MLLSKEYKDQFRIDWKELTTNQLQDKYIMSEGDVYDLAKRLGLPRRGPGWWPQSKLVRFLRMYKSNTLSTMMAEFEISESTVRNKAKEFGLTT